jgi:Protein of unknown function (DUF1592)/Protein of unknown function (DUF1588)/Protein of unknown function (DUF1587)/Protein of unknown function (DUF1585)/Protein of unknown function (DUF1595)/Planctomycete cytochrome C
MPTIRLPFLLLAILGVSVPTLAAEPDFEQAVRPFLKTYCLGCHGERKQEGKLDLSTETSAARVLSNPGRWDGVLERLEADEMPPPKAPKQPTRDERRAVVAWLNSLRDRDAQAHAGDPDRVLARRLSNAEYDNTIRDLTGIDLRPTREFPVDPANEAGFDNSGESLTMSPALAEKYLTAARAVADHLVLMPQGFVFAPDPVVTDTNRDQFCVSRIVDFYQRHRVDLAAYFHAAWQYRHRADLGLPDASIRDVALRAGVNPRYLVLILKTLGTPAPTVGPIGELQSLWNALPTDEAEARRGFEAMREAAQRLRKSYETTVDRLMVRGISPGSQPLVLWKNGEQAARRMRAPGERNPPDVVEFCRVFPDAYAISERPGYFEGKNGSKGRLLSAGFHLMQGYFRDDAPLYELVLDDAGRREIDALWRELDFVTNVPARQYKDFIFFERGEPPRFMLDAEFDFARSEDKDSASDAKIERLRVAYLAKARRNKANPAAVEAIDSYFRTIAASIRADERDRLTAEPSHLDALVAFSSRAQRRPMTASERDELLSFYHRLRRDDGLSHEEAMRDTLASVLVSPRVLFRADLAPSGATAGPLTDFDLASRLSYFLWATMPDETLLARAAAGDLHQPSVLQAQVRRMLRDDRIRGLAEGFAANWLDCRRFDEHNGVDRARFPTFTNDLRRAMSEEPLRYFEDVVRRDRPIVDLIDGIDTLVNPILAAHYGIPVPKEVGAHDWFRVDDARPYGRGGLLPMAVFLTKNAPGLRTSPVKRGYWVVRRVLGEHIPAPPPEVPELPKDEATLGELTLPQVLARHRAHEACAGCHRRFDSIGLAFEAYGPIGERRTRDLGGHPVQTRATFPDGRDRDGLDGLRHYLDERRRDEFLENFRRKLFSYALGRGLIPSDAPTLATFAARLSADGQRFGTLVEAIVTSPQFLHKRGRDDARE